MDNKKIDSQPSIDDGSKSFLIGGQNLNHSTSISQIENNSPNKASGNITPNKASVNNSPDRSQSKLNRRMSVMSLSMTNVN